MPDERDLDIKKAIEQGTQRMTLKDLASQGFDNVKVLDEDAVEAMISKAVDRVVSSQTSEQREKILADSRKELDRLMREQKAMRSRAQLLESDKHELIEQVESLQRELQLQGELEEENLHKKVQEGIASLQAQVDGLRGQAEAARAETARLQEDKARLVKEAGRAQALEKDLAEQESRTRGAEKARTDLVAQVLDLQSRSEGREQELKSLRPEVVRQRSELARLGQDLEQARAEGQAVRGDLEREARAAREAEGLRVEVSRLGQAADEAHQEKARLEKRLAEEARAREEAQRTVTVERERLAAVTARFQEEASGQGSRLAELEKAGAAARAAGEQEVRSARDEAARLGARVAELEKAEAAARAEKARLEQRLVGEERERERLTVDQAAREQEARAGRAESARLGAKVAELEHSERAERERLDAENGTLKREIAASRVVMERLKAEVADRTRLEEALGDARREKAERERLDAENATLKREVQAVGVVVARLREEVADRTRLQEELEGARQEAAFVKGQLAQQQKDHESQREKTVIVTAELQEIEEQQRAEQGELDRFRAESERLAADLESARSEVGAMQDLLGREQEAARVSQNETVALQSRIADAQARSEAVEREIQALQVENARLKERLASAHLQERLAGLETLLESARKSSSAAKASSLQSKEVTTQLERTLARQLRPKGKKRGASLAGGAAFDGVALLEDFFRKVRLKELFQKHVPVQERPGERHPSEMLVEVVKAIVAGEPRRGEGKKVVPLEIVGPSGAPDAASLRQFLGRLSPQAVRALSNVHHGLRLHLTPLPARPRSLTRDGTAVELGKKGRASRPLLCFEPSEGEFWNGQFRSNRPPDADGMRDFLKACIARVPSPFARSRIRFRMESDFFNEGVIRLLESKGVSYVIAAPDSPGLRKLSRRCAFSRLSNGWEVAEFSQRLHAIRRTQARFVVLRRRLSKKAKESGPGTFRDERHVYHVMATDRRGTPWRSFEFHAARGASIEKARGLLADFSASPLLGRSRRSVAALFQAHLLASDLVQGFRRSCLPAEEKSRGLEELRSEFLMVPPKSGTRSLLILPRRDRRRRLFARVSRLTRRLRPARPFTFKS